MTSRTPLFINSSGDPQQFQAGDAIPMIFGGVGQKQRGNVEITSGTTRIPYDNTVPIISEGTELWSTTITPTIIGANMLIEFAGVTDTSKINLVVTVAVFRDNTLIGFIPTASSGYNGLLPAPFSIRINDPVTSLTPVTYSCRIGISANGTWYFGRGATNSQGGFNQCGWTVSEEL